MSFQNFNYLQPTFKTNQEKLAELKSLLEDADLTNELDREEFFLQLDLVINDSSMKSVILRDLVGHEKIERLLFDVVDCLNQQPAGQRLALCSGIQFLEYVAKSGYEDEYLDLGEGGNEPSSLRRTTPVHRAGQTSTIHQGYA
ncbi:hypothetical protein TKK_0004539 [Trichogramma kaykai]